MATVNEEKYRNAILYFAHHVRQVGRTKLWKLLYYLDFDHYERYGTSVTGAQYWRWDNGPVPSTGLAMTRQMQVDGDIDIVPQPTGFQNSLLLVVPLHPFDRSVFTDTEWEMLQAVARKWKFHTARDMSNATHGERPWQEAEPNGFLDYKLAAQRGSEGGEDDSDQVDTEGSDMSVRTGDVTLAKARSLAYAERIERQWDADSAVRARIERGIREMEAGQFVPFSIDAAINQRRQRHRPSQG